MAVSLSVSTSNSGDEILVYASNWKGPYTSILDEIILSIEYAGGSYHSWWYADDYVTGPRVYVGGSGLKVEQSWSSGGKASAKARFWDVDEVAQSAAVNV